MMIRAVFVDRDGVLNRDSPGFVKSPEEFVLLPGASEAVAQLARAGFAVVVVTNQSGIARGLVTESVLATMHTMLRAAIERAGGHLAGIYYCPHLPGEGCECRKPATGMLRQAVADLGIDLSESFMVGDKPADIACGHAAGCRTVLVLTGQTRDVATTRFDPAPDHVAADLSEAATWITAQPPRQST